MCVASLTPLHRAAYWGHGDFTALLLTHSATVNAKNKCEWTPLHFAASSGRSAMVQLLLRHDADINATTNSKWYQDLFEIGR
eukprot:m.659528 g.659528  ORF g.659528 m.659528 type:complete len:82 (-) comp22724_c2_seq3:714-959(-)